MFRTFCKLSILVIFFALCLCSPSFGQNPNDIAQAIDKLNRTIEQVKELVESFNNDRARQFVIQAVKLRDEAVTAIHNREFVKARTKVNLAFSLLKKAAELALAVPIRRLQSQLEELLQKADYHVLGSCNKKAERILQEAKSNRDQAITAATSGQTQKAAEHYRVAVELALRAIDIVKRSHNVNVDRIQDDRHKLESLAERAREVVENCHNDRAKQIFKKAMELAFEAEKALRDCRHELAKRLYNRSLLLLLRAIDLCSGDQSIDQISRAKIRLFQLRKEIDDSQELIARSGNPTVRRLFERVIRFADEAESAINRNRQKEALSKIELAEKMLKRALRIARPGGRGRMSHRISDEIENTKAEISEAYARLTSDSSADAEILLRMADLSIHQAEEAAANGFNRIALEAVLAAQKFLIRVERILDKRQPVRLSHEKIQSRLNQLNEAIAEAESRVAESEQAWLRQLLQSAKDIHKIAVESLETGNYRAANEGIQVAFELIRKIMKNTPNR